jgi:digeranylgeranylglycerophospholipid reductase
MCTRCELIFFITSKVISDNINNNIYRTIFTKTEYDVVVVGAGPSGSIAAREAAKAGLDTLLIEKRQEIGEPVRCAEGVPGKGLQEFIDLDRKWVCADVYKARLFAPDHECIIRLSQPPGEHAAGYVLDRKIFDRALARSAAEAGADVITKTQATSLVSDKERIIGIRGKSRGDDFEIRAKIVIGADGVESKVGRWAGITGATGLNDMGSCAQFHLMDIDIERDCCDIYFGNHIAPGGYAWVFPKGDGEANVGLGIIASKIRDKHPVQYLRSFVEKTFPESTTLGCVVGATPVGGMPKRLSCSGVMLAGDSARLADPLLGAGIVNAMRSGRTAAKVAADAIAKGDLSDKYLQRYDSEIWATIGRGLARNHRVKSIYDRMNDHQVNLLLRSFKRMNAEQMSLSKIFSTASSPDTDMVKILRAMI